MSSSTSGDEERAEVGAVLHSGLFARAPNLERFFRYVCERHLQGQAEELKEYSIAVEALGRAPQFDPKKDSIVRVEAHRLRKRLGDYYAGFGADHKIHIVIPRGGYAPLFVPADQTAVAPEPETDLLSDVEEVPSLDQTRLTMSNDLPRIRFPLSSRMFNGLLGLMLVAAAVAFFEWRTVYSSTAQNAGEVWKGTPSEVVPAEFHMLAGYHGATFSDAQGRDWHSDAFYSGGRSIDLPRKQPIQGLSAANFLRSVRTGQFRYDIPVREGVYEVHLYFVETEFGNGNPKGGGDGSRLFRISINGISKLDLLDVHAEAGGPNRLFARVFKDISPAADGKIHLVMDPVSAPAFLNALEILPSATGRIRPIRIVAQDHSVTDSSGQVWSADEYVFGGTMVLRRQARFQEPDFQLYQGERYGNFSYHIPLAPGKYRLKLHFAETWFGTPEGRVSSSEHRLFDVYANGLALVRQLDVLREAGTPNRGIEKVYDGLEPNAQGELYLQFVPISNYAEINAIEVLETE